MEDALGRFPVLSDGKKGDISNDFGGAIKRYAECFPVKNRKGRFYKRVKKDGSGFTKSQVVGKDAVTKLVRQDFKMMGLKHWEVIRPHALRGHFASMLANDPNVNLKESLVACRHKSAKTNQNYQQIGTQSECNRITAVLPSITSTVGVSIKSPAPEPSVINTATPSHAPVNNLSVARGTTEEPTESYIQMTQTMQQIPVPDDSPSTFVPNTTTTTSTMTSPEFASSLSSTSMSHTQVQIECLYRDMAVLEATHCRNANVTIQNMRRSMSECEAEVRMLHRLVQQMDRELRLSILPYENDHEETEALISQSISHDMEESRRRSYNEYRGRRFQYNTDYNKRSRKSW